MNKQGPKGIGWCDYTWNPINGKCKYCCKYCYVERLRKRFKWDDEIKLNEKELNTKQPQHKKIFVCSCHDLFGEWIPSEWIQKVIDIAKNNPTNTYQFLTKNPKRYLDFCFPENCWLGCTIDTQERALASMDYINSIFANVAFISFEPLLEEIRGMCFSGIDLIIIGADSNKGAAKPEKEWADNLIAIARKLKIAVFIKNNFDYPEIIKEFP